MCVQNFNDSRGIAIRMTYRISLRSSSLWEPRHPLLKVVSIKSDGHPHNPKSPSRQRREAKGECAGMFRPNRTPGGQTCRTGHQTRARLSHVVVVSLMGGPAPEKESHRETYPNRRRPNGERNAQRPGTMSMLKPTQYKRGVSRRRKLKRSWTFRCGNDPSAGSPTETLLRLHLPLDDKV